MEGLDFINFHKLHPSVQIALIAAMTILAIVSLMVNQPVIAYLAIISFAPTPVAIVIGGFMQLNKAFALIKVDKHG